MDFSLCRLLVICSIVPLIASNALLHTSFLQAMSQELNLWSCFLYVLEGFQLVLFECKMELLVVSVIGDSISNRPHIENGGRSIDLEFILFR